MSIPPIQVENSQGNNGLSINKIGSIQGRRIRILNSKNGNVSYELTGRFYRFVLNILAFFRIIKPPKYAEKAQDFLDVLKVSTIVTQKQKKLDIVAQNQFQRTAFKGLNKVISKQQTATDSIVLDALDNFRTVYKNTGNPFDQLVEQAEKIRQSNNIKDAQLFLQKVRTFKLDRGAVSLIHFQEYIIDQIIPKNMPSQSDWKSFSQPVVEKYLKKQPLIFDFTKDPIILFGKNETDIKEEICKHVQYEFLQVNMSVHQLPLTKALVKWVNEHCSNASECIAKFMSLGISPEGSLDSQGLVKYFSSKFFDSMNERGIHNIEEATHIINKILYPFILDQNLSTALLIGDGVDEKNMQELIVLLNALEDKNIKDVTEWIADKTCQQTKVSEKFKQKNSLITQKYINELEDAKIAKNQKKIKELELKFQKIDNPLKMEQAALELKKLLSSAIDAKDEQKIAHYFDYISMLYLSDSYENFCDKIAEKNVSENLPDLSPNGKKLLQERLTQKIAQIKKIDFSRDDIFMPQKASIVVLADIGREIHYVLRNAVETKKVCDFVLGREAIDDDVYLLATIEHMGISLDGKALDTKKCYRKIAEQVALSISNNEDEVKKHCENVQKYLEKNIDKTDSIIECIRMYLKSENIDIHSQSIIRNVQYKSIWNENEGDILQLPMNVCRNLEGKVVEFLQQQTKQSTLEDIETVNSSRKHITQASLLSYQIFGIENNNKRSKEIGEIFSFQGTDEKKLLPANITPQQVAQFALFDSNGTYIKENCDVFILYILSKGFSGLLTTDIVKIFYQTYKIPTDNGIKEFHIHPDLNREHRQFDLNHPKKISVSEEAIQIEFPTQYFNIFSNDEENKESIGTIHANVVLYVDKQTGTFRFEVKHELDKNTVKNVSNIEQLMTYILLRYMKFE